MSRSVSGDHILFDECIHSFRLKPDGYRLKEGPSRAYLFTDFCLNTPWNLPNFTVNPSIRVELPTPYRAFISKIDNVESCDANNPHLYGIALSAIISFTTGRVCKSTRDDYTYLGPTLTDKDATALSLSHPVVAMGLGAVSTTLSERTLNKYKEDISSIVDSLHAVPYEKYVVLMQAIRLVHLSILIRKEDFGLAYSMIVAAIEAVAQKAISRNKVKTKNPKEKQWELRANTKGEEEFSELFELYKTARGQNSYLTERYIKFINDFAPTADWDSIVDHPQKNSLESFEGFNTPEEVLYATRKRWWEKYPSDFTDDEIKEILIESYSHRSCFVHRGEQPPHQSPVSHDRFFQMIPGYGGDKYLPNYELLLGIAQLSIRNWMNKN
ncbi:hypothetical protein D3C75_191100 [compost metagenome]